MSIPRFLLLGLAASFTTGLKAEDKLVQESTVRVMTYNALHGGTKRGQPLQAGSRKHRSGDDLQCFTWRNEAWATLVPIGQIIPH